MLRFLCQVSSIFNFSHLGRRLLCSIALNHLVTPLWYDSFIENTLPLRRPWRGVAPPITVSLFCGFRSFHCSKSVLKWIKQLNREVCHVAHIASDESHTMAECRGCKCRGGTSRKHAFRKNRFTIPTCIFVSFKIKF